MADRPLAYALRSFDPPRDLRSAAHLGCAKCGNMGKVHIAGFGNNPNKIEKAFIQIGWSCNVHKPRECICPKCVREQRIRAEEALPPEPIPDNVRVLATINKPTPPSVVSSPKVDERPKSMGTVAMHDIGIRALSAEQKKQLREELDSTFDDSTGRYLEGNSDHKISEKLNIPRVTVQEFRENMYGELREDPEIAELKAIYVEIEKAQADIQNKMTKALVRLESISKRYGV